MLEPYSKASPAAECTDQTTIELTTSSDTYGDPSLDEGGDLSSEPVNRVLNWPRVSAWTQHPWYSPISFIVILSYVVAVALGVTSIEDPGVQAGTTLYGTVFGTVFIVMNLTICDRTLVRQVFGSFDWFVASISLIASAVASEWMHSYTYVLPAPILNSALLWIGTSIAFAVDAAPKMQMMAWVGLLFVLLVNTFRFVLLAWEVSDEWPQKYLCLMGTPSEPRDRSNPEDGYTHCITSRDLFFGGQNYVLLFTIKYLALYAVARYRGTHRQRRCIILRQPMQIVLLQPHAVPKSLMTPSNRTRTVTNSTASSGPNMNHLALPPPSPQSRQQQPNLRRAETEYDLSSTEEADSLPYFRIRLQQVDVPEYTDPSSEYHLVPLKDVGRITEHDFRPLIYSKLLFTLGRHRAFTSVTSVLYAGFAILSAFPFEAALPVTLISLFYWPILIGTLMILTSHVDRTLLRRCMRTFDWWLLLGYLAMHIFASVYSNIRTSGSVAFSLLQDVFFVCLYLTFMTLDAMPTMPGSIKRLLTGGLVANSLRIFIQNYCTSTVAYHSYPIDFFFSTTSHDMAMSTLTTLTLYLVRFLVLLIRAPNVLMLLRRKVAPQLNLVRMERNHRGRARERTMTVAL